MNLLPDRGRLTSRSVDLLDRSVGLTNSGYALGCRDQLTQQPQPLCPQFNVEEVDAGGIAARPIEARDQTEADRVAAREDDRDRRGRRLGRQRRSGVPARRSRSPDGEPDRPRARAVDRIAPSAQRYSIATFWPST